MVGYHFNQDLFYKVKACVQFFRKNGKKKDKIFENFGKNVQNLELYWERVVIACNYHMQWTTRIDPVKYWS